MSYLIRTADLTDQPRLRELGRHFLRLSIYADLLGTNDRMDELVAQVLMQGVIFVGEANGRIEGLLALIVGAHPVTGDLYGDEVAWWVEPAHRNTSLGGRLLRYMERWAVAEGLHFVKMVAPESEQGHYLGDFYRRAGYVPVEAAFIKRLSWPDSQPLPSEPESAT